MRGYLKLGDQNEDVKTLQEKLVQLGYNLFPSEVDSFFGVETENAVKQFQHDHNIPVTGKVGLPTLAKINELLSKLHDKPMPPGEENMIRIPGSQVIIRIEGNKLMVYLNNDECINILYEDMKYHIEVVVKDEKKTLI